MFDNRIGIEQKPHCASVIGSISCKEAIGDNRVAEINIPYAAAPIERGVFAKHTAGNNWAALFIVYSAAIVTYSRIRAESAIGDMLLAGASVIQSAHFFSGC